MLINVEIQPDRLKWVTEAEVDGEVEEIIADEAADAVAVMVVLVGNLARSKWLLSIQDFIWYLNKNWHRDENDEYSGKSIVKYNMK